MFKMVNMNQAPTVCQTYCVPVRKTWAHPMFCYGPFDFNQARAVQRGKNSIRGRTEVSTDNFWLK